MTSAIAVTESLSVGHKHSFTSFRKASEISAAVLDQVILLDFSKAFDKERSSSASSFRASLLQAIDGGVMSLAALCPQVVSQAPQHFRSSGRDASHL